MRNLFVFLFFLSVSALAQQPFQTPEHPRTLRYFAADQQTFLFVTDVLKLALEKNPTLSDVHVETLHHVENNEGRTLSLLDRNIIDIFWEGASDQRQRNYAAVRFPLVRGLLGYRNFLTHKDNLPMFQNITENTLKSMVACQGTSWPDTDILTENGYTVATASKYLQLVRLINIKRCDYFPRAVYEGLNEIKWLEDKYPDIRLVRHVMLSYQFPIYFFLRKSDQKLAEEIEKGLYLALEDGSYQALFRSHASMQYLYPLSQWQHATIFRLNNPLLSEKNPTDTRLWLSLK
ncbi:hypothetical protein DRW07_10035 [Alteromonas sediminis]|uniref:Solute-binding protein family 3/N-terminal domain-containing protein n=1 Tax=Alteromonas sediminis TaxID=2259342 RepID=A0A3N5YBM7_9ALTE|nr:hypothetical protein [Alteromonas sediminis]RPJ66425.1 hypothetical protein DRW07_10035 [Alteromonas sediminis]